MAHPTTLPLSQQLATWTLQALGLLEAPNHMSRSSAKNLLRGEVAGPSWDAMVEELLHLVGVPVGADKRAALEAAMHEFDRRVSELDDCGLSIGERLPAVLRLLAPQLGCRFGALAALVDQGRWQVPAAEDGSTLPVADWLCDPLHPATFGRAAELVLRRRYPDWSPWGARSLEIEQRNVVSRKTASRWASDEVHVPNNANVNALAGEMPEGEPRVWAFRVLRVARLLTVLRKTISHRWGDAMLAQDFSASVASFARFSRAALREPGPLADLAEFYANVLTQITDADVLARVFPVHGQALVGIERELASKMLRDQAKTARTTGNVDALRTLVDEQVFNTSPLLLTGAMMHLGASGPPLLLMESVTDPIPAMQSAWRSTAVLKALAGGGPFFRHPPGSADHGAWRPSSTIREVAMRLIEEGRVLIRRAEASPREVHAPTVLAIQIALETESVDSIEQAVDQWNEALTRAAIPAGLEQVADDDIVAEAPHLLAQRARRLAEQGATTGEILDCIQRWAEGRRGPRPWEDNLAVATALVALGHTTMDRQGPVIHALGRIAALDLEAFPADVAAQLRRAAAPALVQRQALGDAASRFLEIATALLVEPPDPTARAFRASLLLPLSIRIDATRRWPGAGDAIDDRASAFATELETALAGLPTYADCWAALVMWQTYIGLDHSFALKQARHFGATATWDRLNAMLVCDGLVDPG